MTDERRPQQGKWREVSTASMVTHERAVQSVSTWTMGRLVVISEVGVIETNQISGQCWFLSLSRKGKRRPNNQELYRALRAFRMPEPWDEDNHMPGRTRGVFCPVDPEQRTSCECKTSEILVIEKDGFRWSRVRGEGETARTEDKREVVKLT